MLLLSLLLTATPARPGPLTDIEAVAMGLPAAGRTWSGVDYEAYASAVEALPFDRLPRVDSPLFQREVAQRNLSVTGPPDTMIGEVVRIGAAHNRVLQRYLAELAGGAPLLPEFLEQMGFSLRWGVREWEVMESFLATLPPEVRAEPVRQSGVAEVRSGTATMLAGALTVLEEPTSWSDPAMATFARELATTVPALLPRLGEPERAEIQRRVDKLVAAVPAGALKQALAPIAAKP